MPLLLFTGSRPHSQEHRFCRLDPFPHLPPGLRARCQCSTKSCLSEDKAAFGKRKSLPRFPACFSVSFPGSAFPSASSFPPLDKAFAADILFERNPGELSEWFKELVLKTSDAARHRGFESLALRQIFSNPNGLPAPSSFSPALFGVLSALSRADQKAAGHSAGCSAVFIQKSIRKAPSFRAFPFSGKIFLSRLPAYPFGSCAVGTRYFAGGYLDGKLVYC